MIRPKALKKGMCIALTAPSGAVRDEAVVPRYKAFLEEHGYSVRVGRPAARGMGIWQAAMRCAREN
jgi:Uncharacterized proteins, homologs of microcin C7 resistance protein MccF